MNTYHKWLKIHPYNNIFRVITSDHGTFSAKLFTESKAPSPFHKVYKNNVDIDSFIKNPSQRLHRFMNYPMSTYFASPKEISQCHVCYFER